MRQVEALSSTTSTLGRLTPGRVMFLIVFSYLSSLIRLQSARVTPISLSRYMLRNNDVFVLKRARNVPYALSRSRLPCWSHNKKVLNAGKDVFTSRQGCLKVTSGMTQMWRRSIFLLKNALIVREEMRQMTLPP